jgi:hypothetical protein
MEVGMKVKKQWLIYGSALLISAGISQTAYAGSINGNEQSVLSAIQGQFEKDGIIYEVKPEYINSARSYLTQDDVDLTGEQAQAAISEIYANVQTGIESGYLVEIGRSAAEETAPEPASLNKEAGRSEGAVISKALEREQTEEVQPSPDESGEMKDEEVRETEAVSHVISILELVDKAPRQSYEYMYTDTNKLMNRVHVNYGILKVLAAGSALSVILTAAAAIYKRLLIVHNHHRLRRILKYILTASIAVQSCILCLCGGAWFGAFQENVILNKLADTGYYIFIYDELRRDTSISFALLNIPDKVMDRSLIYEKVVIAARQQVENDLRQGDYRADTFLLVEPLKKDIEEYLKGQSITITKEAEAGLDLLMKRLDGKYTALLKWPFSSWWLYLQNNFRKTAIVVLPLTVFFMITAQVLLFFIHHYKYRGFVLGAKGLIGGSVAGFLTFTAGNLMTSKQLIEVTPLYMNTFFQIYRVEIWKAGMFICVIGILLGCMVLAGVKAWKEGR